MNKNNNFFNEEYDEKKHKGVASHIGTKIDKTGYIDEKGQLVRYSEDEDKEVKYLEIKNEKIVEYKNIIEKWKEEGFHILHTHNGKAHADDFLTTALYMLENNLEPEDVKLVRTRDNILEEQLDENANIIYDKGGVYNPDKNKYDHHQQGDKNVISETAVTLYAKETGYENIVYDPYLEKVEKQDNKGRSSAYESLGLEKKNGSYDDFEQKYVVFDTEILNDFGGEAEKKCKWAGGKIVECYNEVKRKQENAIKIAMEMIEVVHKRMNDEENNNIPENENPDKSEEVKFKMYDLVKQVSDLIASGEKNINNINFNEDGGIVINNEEIWSEKIEKIENTEIFKRFYNENDDYEKSLASNGIKMNPEKFKKVFGVSEEALLNFFNSSDKDKKKIAVEYVMRIIENSVKKEKEDELISEITEKSGQEKWWNNIFDIKDDGNIKYAYYEKGNGWSKRVSDSVVKSFFQENPEVEFRISKNINKKNEVSAYFLLKNEENRENKVHLTDAVDDSSELGGSIKIEDKDGNIEYTLFSHKNDFLTSINFGEQVDEERKDEIFREILDRISRGKKKRDENEKDK